MADRWNVRKAVGVALRTTRSSPALWRVLTFAVAAARAAAEHQRRPRSYTENAVATEGRRCCLLLTILQQPSACCRTALLQCKPRGLAGSRVLQHGLQPDRLDTCTSSAALKSPVGESRHTHIRNKPREPA